MKAQITNTNVQVIPKTSFLFMSKTFISLLIVVIFIGIFFRAINLEGKIVWHDEALTISRVSGYYAEQINTKVFNSEIISLSKLKQYQQKNPQSKNSDVVKILAANNPQHPPIYYFLLRLWGNIWGYSIEVFRSLSALFGILIMFAVYLLCWELKKDKIVSLTATALIAISPAQVLYAQEAREYSLWTLSVLVSSLLFLKAIKNQYLWHWIGYGLCSLASIYVFPFSVSLLLGQGIYFFLTKKYISKQNTKYFISSFLFSIAGAFPWLWLILTNWDESGSEWTTATISRFSLLNKWGENIYKIFILNLPSNRMIYSIILIFILIILASSFFTVIKAEKRDNWLYILLLASIFFIPLAFADILLGGQRSTSSRYVLPSLLGIEIGLAFGLSHWLRSSKTFIHQLGSVIAVIIFLVGTVSCTINSTKNIAWSKGGSEYLIKTATIINQAEKPLIVGNSLGLNFGNILALTHQLNKETNFLLVDGWKKPDYENIPEIPQDFDSIFFLSLSEKFQQQIEQKYAVSLESIYYHDQLNVKKLTR
jgi:uncharacterized membrane protein